MFYFKTQLVLILMKFNKKGKIHAILFDYLPRMDADFRFDTNTTTKLFSQCHLVELCFQEVDTNNAKRNSLEFVEISVSKIKIRSKY